MLKVDRNFGPRLRTPMRPGVPEQQNGRGVVPNNMSSGGALPSPSASLTVPNPTSYASGISSLQPPSLQGLQRLSLSPNQVSPNLRY